jgi:hypothetical protein
MVRGNRTKIIGNKKGRKSVPFHCKKSKIKREI